MTNPFRASPACRRLWFVILISMLAGRAGQRAGAETRPPQGEKDLRFWMENMLVHHRYTTEEAAAVTGLTPAKIASARERLHLPDRPPKSEPSAPLKVLPYPGGRHPRLGFFDGAIEPQRDTKLSVFTPWDDGGYVVVDAPEAIWSNLGLTYLAHRHIDTIWSSQGITLEKLEWSHRADGAWRSERRLPNGISFGVRAMPRAGHVEFVWWLLNGTAAPLLNLRAQVCAMLGHADGFAAQSEDNKRIEAPFAAVHDPSGRRWIITAWDGLDRAWQNPPVPCLHSDPRLSDCPPGEIRSARGWLWFYEGDDVGSELQRLRRTYVEAPVPAAPKTLEPVPDKLVVLTFDDSSASHFTTVRPLLKELGFGATFFITEGFGFSADKTNYMTWEQIAVLHREGFEIGNHTRSHTSLTGETLAGLREEVRFINDRCAARGIPQPVSFAYPGNAIHPAALPILQELGLQWARRGAQPERPYESGEGIAYEPMQDHPLLLPTSGDARPDWTLSHLRKAVEGARDGRIAVLQFHGVPDREHPWVSTPPERFAEYMRWLKTEGYRGVSVRALARYIDPADRPAEPWAVIEKRQAAGKAIQPSQPPSR